MEVLVLENQLSQIQSLRTLIKKAILELLSDLIVKLMVAMHLVFSFKILLISQFFLTTTLRPIFWR